MNGKKEVTGHKNKYANSKRLGLFSTSTKSNLWKNITCYVSIGKYILYNGRHNLKYFRVLN